MSVFKKSRRWLWLNIGLLNGMIVLGLLAQPNSATLNGATPIGACNSLPREGGPYTGCVAPDLICGIPGGGVGTCQFVNPQVGCPCVP
jgi:hypothetical protein